MIYTLRDITGSTCLIQVLWGLPLVNCHVKCTLQNDDLSEKMPYYKKLFLLNLLFLVKQVLHLIY